MRPVETVREFLDAVGKEAPSELLLRRGLNENWFSDTLGWLCDPSGSHGAGIDFLETFVSMLAKKRSEEEQDYKRREYHLKFGKGGAGRGASSFNLGNAASVREFYLSRCIDNEYLSGPRYCDLVLGDLDTDDSFLLVIENKLFTTNRPRQLWEYFKGVERHYANVKTREFAYLSLTGRSPELYDAQHRDITDHWLAVSWVDDILPLLQEVTFEEQERVSRFKGFLEWIRTLVLHDSSTTIEPASVEELHEQILKAVGECLHEELNRIHRDGTTSEWVIEEVSAKRVRLIHSRYPARYLYVEMLPNFSIILQTRKRSQTARSEKVLVPFGAPTDQVYNLLDIAARDTYYKHLDRPSEFLSNRRRLRATRTEKKKEHETLFDFIHEHRFGLKVMLNICDEVWDAARSEADMESEN
jgi:hypothetical protein